MVIAVKRAYQPAAADDGYRILVDRLWPRGLTKEKVAADLWLKEAGPSTELRQWFDHDPAKWLAFQAKYKEELKDNPAFQELLEDCKKHEKVTLIYAAKDEIHNEAQVLAALIKQSMGNN